MTPVAETQPWSQFLLSADGVVLVIAGVGSFAVLGFGLVKLTNRPDGERTHQLRLLALAAVSSWFGFWSVAGSVAMGTGLTEGAGAALDALSAVLILSLWSFPFLATGGALTQSMIRRRKLIDGGASARGRVLGTKQHASPLAVSTKSVLYQFSGADGVRRQGQSPWVVDEIADPVAQRGWIRIAYDSANPLRHAADIYDHHPLPTDTR